MLDIATGKLVHSIEMVSEALNLSVYNNMLGCRRYLQITNKNMPILPFQDDQEDITSFSLSPDGEVL